MAFGSDELTLYAVFDELTDYTVYHFKTEEAIEDLVTFLTHWLAFHILEDDTYLAHIVLGVQRGQSLAAAKEAATSQMKGAARGGPAHDAGPALCRHGGAHIGGDEFVLLLGDLTQASEATQLLERLLHDVSQPIDVGTHRVRVATSVGATLYPNDAGDADELLTHADQMLYAAKSEGKNCLRLYHSA